MVQSFLCSDHVRIMLIVHRRVTNTFKVRETLKCANVSRKLVKNIALNPSLNNSMVYSSNFGAPPVAKGYNSTVGL